MLETATENAKKDTVPKPQSFPEKSDVNQINKYKTSTVRHVTQKQRAVLDVEWIHEHLANDDQPHAKCDQH